MFRPRVAAVVAAVVAVVAGSVAVLPARPAAAVPPGAGEFVPLSPVRVYSQAVGASSTTSFSGVNVGGVPAAGVAALQFQLTAVSGGTGTLTVFPTGVARPATPNLGYRPNVATTNDVVVRLGTGNQFSIANLPASGTGQAATVSVAVTGYFLAAGGTTAGSGYVPLTPARLFAGQALAASGTVALAPLGRGGLPRSGVSAVAVQFDVQAAGATLAAGTLSAFPGPTAPNPRTVDVSYGTDGPYSGLATVKLAADGTFRLSASSAAQVSVDVVGYYRDSGGATYVPLNPARTVPGTAIAAGGSIVVPVLGQGGVPSSGVTAVAYDLTASSTAAATAMGGLVAYPADQPRPGTAGHRWHGGNTLWPTEQITRLGTGGIRIFNFGSVAVNVTVDVSGYFAQGPVPGAPTMVSATAADGAALVSWHAPGGGAAPTGYVVLADPGGRLVQLTGTGTSTQVTGLTNGTEYTFSVAAANSAGTGPFSAPSGGITPAPPQPPDAPLLLDVFPRDRALRVSWSPPGIGSSAITGYRISTQATGVTPPPAPTLTQAGPDAEEAIVTGLTDGQPYVVTVAAVNAVGVGAASQPSPPATPGPADPPLAPAVTALVPGNGTATVQWVLPADGGAAITQYTVTATADHQPDVVATSPADTTVLVLSNLADGADYTVSVVATNAAGSSPPGTAGPVRPAATIPPGAPTHVRAAVAAPGSVRVDWQPPDAAGTAPIASYTVSADNGGGSTTVAGTATSATLGNLAQDTDYTFTVQAASAAGPGPASDATAALTPALTAVATPVVLSPAALATLRAVHADALDFEQPPAEVAALQPGQIIVARPAAPAPTGLLRAVTATNTTNGLFVVSTRGATMTEVLSAGAMVQDGQLDTGDLAGSFVPLLPGVRLSQPTIRGRTAATGAPRIGSGARPADISGSLGIRDGALVLEFEGTLFGKVGPARLAGELLGQLVVRPELAEQIHIGLHGIDTRFHLGAHTVAQLHATGGIGKEETYRVPVPLARFSQCGDIQVGPLPVVICLDINATLQVSGHIAVGMSLSATFERTIGATLFSHNLQASAEGVNEAGPANGLGGPQLALAADLKVGVPILFSYFLYDAAGPGISVQPYVELIEHSNQEPPLPRAELRIGAQVGVNFSLSRLLGGTVLLDDPALINFFLTVWTYTGPEHGLTVQPDSVEMRLGDQQGFGSQGFGDVPADAAVNWRVKEGVGSIDRHGVYTGSQLGYAIVEASLVDEPDTAGLAGVTVGPNIPGVPGNLVARPGRLSADLRWTPPATNGGSPITGYAVSTIPASTTTRTDGTATSLHVGSLDPTVRYTFRVYAINAVGTSRPAVADPVTPFEALIRVGAANDVAVDADGNPDDQAMAGRGGVRLSGDGRYAFFITFGASNLAPPDVAAPDNFNLYLLRKDLRTGAIDLASRGPDGHTPQPVLQSYSSFTFLNGIDDFITFDASRDGSVVAFAASPSGIMVHDLAHLSTWTASAAGTLSRSPVLSDDGATVGLTVATGGGTHHVLRFTAAGGTQVDTCTAGPCVWAFDMAGSGNRFAVVEEDNATGHDHLYVYDTGGARADLNPVPASNLDPVIDLGRKVRISADGSTVAVQYQDDNIGRGGLAITPVIAGRLTFADVVAPYLGRIDETVPRGMSRDGRTVAYTFPDPPDDTVDADDVLAGYLFTAAHTGTVRVPGPAAHHGESLLDVSDDGLLVAWTRCADTPSGGTCQAGPGAWVQKYA